MEAGSRRGSVELCRGFVGSVSGIGINVSLEAVFGVKILKFFGPESF